MAIGGCFCFGRRWGELRPVVSVFTQHIHHKQGSWIHAFLKDWLNLTVMVIRNEIGNLSSNPG